MKNLYHLLVTSYKLRVTNLLCRISDIGYRISFIAFCFLPAAVLAQTQEAEVTDVVFSCPGIVEITYDLPVSRCVEVTLEYSPDKCTWNPVPGATGAVGLQSSGTGKKILWNSAANNASFGKLYFRVLYSYAYAPTPNCDDLGGVMINGKCWAQHNLAVGGDFAIDHTYSGNNNAALFQWGRRADGHEARNSPTTGTRSSTDDPGHNMFIISSPDWRTPRNDFLWNSGTETCPVKTANDPCPEHWRVPTHTELETLGVSLTDQTYVTKVWQSDYESTGINGYLCTDNAPPYNSLFLPAAGERYLSNLLLDVGMGGGYWSSAPLSTNAYFLYINNGTFDPATYFRSNGFSVRCVSEN